MKHYRMELVLGAVALIVMLTCSAGCTTVRGNRALGASIVTAARLSGEVEMADLRVARDYLVQVEKLLRADTSEVPVVLADVLTVELLSYGGELTVEEQAIVANVVDLLCMGIAIQADEPEDYATDIPERLSDVVAGMIVQVDRLTGT